MALQFQSFMEVSMSKRSRKTDLMRIHWLCYRCDIDYELLYMPNGQEHTVLLWHSETPETKIAESYTLSGAIRFLEKFYHDLRAEHKSLRKEDKLERSRILDLCTEAGMACSITIRTRLKDPSYKLYKVADHEQALVPELSVDEVQYGINNECN